jgi:hypothetical protein
MGTVVGEPVERDCLVGDWLMAESVHELEQRLPFERANDLISKWEQHS